MTHTPMRGCEWCGKRPVLDGHPIGVRDKKGGDWDDPAWSEVLRVRQMPGGTP